MYQNIISINSRYLFVRISYLYEKFYSYNRYCVNNIIWFAVNNVLFISIRGRSELS